MISSRRGDIVDILYSTPLPAPPSPPPTSRFPLEVVDAPDHQAIPGQPAGPARERSSFLVSNVRFELAVAPVGASQPSPGSDWFGTLTGDLDLYAALCLAESAGRIGSMGVIAHIDMSGVTFIDAAGIGLLTALRKRLINAGGELLLEHVTPRTERILRISGTGAFHR